MEIAILGVVTFFNFMILKWKFEHNRYGDLVLDVTVFATVSYMFSGTITGLTIAMIASMLMSLYLMVFPPKVKTKTRRRRYA